MTTINTKLGRSNNSYGRRGGFEMNFSFIKTRVRQLLIGVLLAMANDAYAQTRIAILDFELSDVTLAPGIPAEVARTASIKAMLEEELQRAGYTIVAVNLDSQHTANGGFGYLFDHNDIAATWPNKRVQIIFWSVNCISPAFCLLT